MTHSYSTAGSSLAEGRVQGRARLGFPSRSYPKGAGRTVRPFAKGRSLGLRLRAQRADWREGNRPDWRRIVDFDWLTREGNIEGRS